MNCRDFERFVIVLARNQSIEAAIREQSLAHAEICGQCGTRLRVEQALLSCINTVVAEIAGDGAPHRVEAALLAAFRAQTPATASSTVMPLPSQTRHWWSWKLAAVAAGILILISVMVIFWRSARLNAPQERNVVSTPPRAPGTGDRPQRAETSADGDRMLAEQPENRRKRVRHRASSDDPDEAEVVTQFFALREGEDLTALESLRLVRVELPGSALSEVGLPVDPEAADSPVKADVMLGQDGLARAIRFVR